MAYDNKDNFGESIFSKRIRAEDRRSYFFDVRATRGNDYYLTITESRKRLKDGGYDTHKIFLYKEDFNKFLKALDETINHVKTELLPDFDFDAPSQAQLDEAEEEDDWMDEPLIVLMPQAVVEIYIPQKDVALLNAERLTNACGDFMEALGFELKTEDEPVFRSFWKKLIFVFKKHVTAEQIEEVFRKGKTALELKHVDLPSAEQTEKLASAAEKIVDALAEFEEGVVRLGNLIVLKKKVNGKPKIVIQQINQEMAKMLDETPQVTKSLQTLYELLTGDTQEQREADNTASPPVVIE